MCVKKTIPQLKKAVFKGGWTFYWATTIVFFLVTTSALTFSKWQLLFARLLSSSQVIYTYIHNRRLGFFIFFKSSSGVEVVTLGLP